MAFKITYRCTKENHLGLDVVQDSEKSLKCQACGEKLPIDFDKIDFRKPCPSHTLLSMGEMGIEE